MPIAEDVTLGANVVVHHPELVNLYGCTIGAGTTIGPFVEIQRGVVVGARSKISSHSFICEGVTIGDEVFIGHGVIFTNDRSPKATTAGQLSRPSDYTIHPTLVENGASIGSGAIILGGITIGSGALIAAGAVVTKDVAKGEVVAGIPARQMQLRPSF